MKVTDSKIWNLDWSQGRLSSITKIVNRRRYKVFSFIVGRKHLITLSIFNIVFSSCVAPQCEEKVLKEVKSPDGKYTAVYFEQNCGATTSILYHVNIRGTSESFKKDSAGHVLDGRVFTGYGYIRMTWKDNNHLLVENVITKGADLSKLCESKWRDIVIECKEQK